MKRFFLVAILMASIARADYITRYVDLALSPDQILDNGEYGSGVFWRPEFPLDPFLLREPGDTIDVTVMLDGRIEVTAGAVEQESVYSYVGTPGGMQNFYDASWVFLNPAGSLFSPSLSMTSASEAWGIGAGFNPVDLTDSAFSFDGIRYTITLLDDPRLAGYPAVFDSGFVAVQTQGEITLHPVAEPTPLWLLLAGILGLLVYRSLDRSRDVAG